MVPQRGAPTIKKSGLGLMPLFDPFVFDLVALIAHWKFEIAQSEASGKAYRQGRCRKQRKAAKTGQGPIRLLEKEKTERKMDAR